MKSELEARLRELGVALELPPTPDLVPIVMARLPPVTRRLPQPRRTLVAALAATVLLAGGALAIPPTRHAILNLLGLRGVVIERVSHLPPIESGSRLGLGQRLPLSHVRHAASFTALLPPGSPAAFLDHDVSGGRISLLIGRVLIIEFRGTMTPFIFKVVGPGTRVTSLRVNRGPGVYLSGAPHAVLFRAATGEYQTDRVRLAGNVLMWQQGPLTIRIEGSRTLGDAIAIARSLR